MNQNAFQHDVILRKYQQLIEQYPLYREPYVYIPDHTRFMLIDQIFDIIQNILPESDFETKTDYFVSLYYFIQLRGFGLAGHLDYGQDYDDQAFAQIGWKKTIFNQLFSLPTQFTREFFEYCFEKEYLDKTNNSLKIAIAKDLLTIQGLEDDYTKFIISKDYEYDTFEYIIYEILDPEFVCSFIDTQVGTFLHYFTGSMLLIPSDVLDRAFDFFDAHGFDYSTPATNLNFLSMFVHDFDFDVIQKFVRRGACFGNSELLIKDLEISFENYITEAEKDEPEYENISMKFFYQLFQLIKDTGYFMFDIRQAFITAFPRLIDIKFCTFECPMYYERCRELLE